MRQLPKPGEIYKHFKGNCYRIITVATHTETGEKLVVYQALYGDYGVYARELSMFLSPVDKDKYPHADQEMRFEPVESGAVSPVEPPKECKGVSESAGGAGEQAAAKKRTGASDSAGSCLGAETAAKKRVVAPDGAVSGPPERGTSQKGQFPEKETESGIDPGVLAYLDADTCKEKLQILRTMRDRLTDGMINTMAIAIDVEVKPGDITERYEELKYCLATKERYECSRLR